MVELSIIIVNWNTKNLLRECINSIYVNKPPFPYEILVVDNASSDGSQEMIKTLFPEVILIENSSNLGYSKANNIGFRNSKGNFILFLNSDTIIPKETIYKAVEFMKNYKDAGIMGCKNLNPDGSLQYSAFPFPSPVRIFALLTGLNRIFKISRFRDFSRIITIDYVSGSFLLIGRETFEKIGGFDENFFMYCEDVDLCKRVWNLGLKVYYNPEIAITHYLGGSSKKNPYIMRSYIESFLLLYKKHFRNMKVLLLKIFLLKAIFARITIVVFKMIFRKHLKGYEEFKFLKSLISEVIND